MCIRDRCYGPHTANYKVAYRTNNTIRTVSYTHLDVYKRQLVLTVKTDKNTQIAISSTKLPTCYCPVAHMYQLSLTQHMLVIPQFPLPMVQLKLNLGCISLKQFLILTTFQLTENTFFYSLTWFWISQRYFVWWSRQNQYKKHSTFFYEFEFDAIHSNENFSLHSRNYITNWCLIHTWKW